MFHVKRVTRQLCHTSHCVRVFDSDYHESREVDALKEVTTMKPLVRNFNNEVHINLFWMEMLY